MEEGKQQGGVTDGLIQVGETISKVLESLGILEHRKVALCQSTKLRFESHSP
jgi:hypothetical protein